MKKILSAFAAFALVAVVGCNSFTDYSPKDATPEDKAFGDSLSEAIGSSLGHDFGNSLEQVDSTLRTKFDKAKILEGIKYALQNMGDTTDFSIRQGLQFGMMIAEEMSGYEVGGVPVNRDKLFKSLEKAFMGDTIPADKLMEVQATGNLFRQRANDKVEAIRKAKLENDPKAIENKKAGEAFIAKKKQENPEAKTTANGTLVVTHQEGTGELIKGSDNVKLIYKGTLTDGTSFDDSKGEAREFNVGGVVPGFSEALQMMKKGGKYTIYIPGPQGYGVNGVPQVGIGPNMALVFDIEVVDIVK
ncbi:MAG: FKBP-type peptidyl-prolyl cis-trans isomerase [Muribaculaceae bacterium]|nr:FKBP-type peptidyl-prolyl cis-trans isomerase [Muribaculaceae bacterium]